jgi:hypothetical protein
MCLVLTSLFYFIGGRSKVTISIYQVDNIYSFRVCLYRANNSVRIKELRIINKDSEKIVIFRLE